MSSATTVIATQAPREQWLSNVQGFAAVPTGSTATTDYSQPVIAVESVDVAENHLRLYLALANPLYDLRLRISAAVLFSKPVEKILRSVLRQKRRFAYDRETSVLRLYAMSRPIHDAVSLLVPKFIVDAIRTGFITTEEEKYINYSSEGRVLAGKVFHAKQNRKKLHAWTKYPDAAILFGYREFNPLPSVIFEVGFAETYNDLVSDAKQWLQKSRGKVRLVILVNIKEDVQSKVARRASHEAQRRIRKLVTDFGRAKAKDEAGIDHDGSDVESDEEMCDDIRCSIVVEDWTILPEPLIQQHPTIYITDIIPEARRAIFQGFDESRTAELDMDLYRELLISGTCRLASHRALEYLRPRDKDDDDEYIPESQ